MNISVDTIDEREDLLDRTFKLIGCLSAEIKNTYKEELSRGLLFLIKNIIIKRVYFIDILIVNNNEDSREYYYESIRDIDYSIDLLNVLNSKLDVCKTTNVYMSGLAKQIVEWNVFYIKFLKNIKGNIIKELKSLKGLGDDLIKSSSVSDILDRLIEEDEKDFRDYSDDQFDDHYSDSYDICM